MNVIDMSTRRLKRRYFKAIRKTWHYEPHRLDGYRRDIGLSAVYWEARRVADAAAQELKSRNVWLPGSNQ